MKTGYFYNLTKNEIKGAVSIAVGNPRYVSIDLKMKELAPSWALLQDFRNEKIDEEEYKRRFDAQLSKLNPHQVMETLETMAGGEEPVIMCHCGKQHFCHRHLVAEWLERELGVEIEEYGVGKVNRQNGRLV